MSKSRMNSFYDYFVPGAVDAARKKAPQGMPSTVEVYTEMWQYPSINGVYFAFAAAIRGQATTGQIPALQVPLDDEITQIRQAQDLAREAIQQGVSCAVSNFFSTKRSNMRSKWRNWYSLSGRWFYITQVIVTPDLARMKAIEYSADIEDLDTWRSRWLRLANMIETSSSVPQGDGDDFDSLLERASNDN